MIQLSQDLCLALDFPSQGKVQKRNISQMCHFSDCVYICSGKIIFLLLFKNFLAS